MRVIARLVGPYLVPISEVAEDDNEVEGRSAHLGETAINPVIGALEMGVFENTIILPSEMRRRSR
jgi:hypothetical protein